MNGRVRRGSRKVDVRLNLFSWVKEKTYKTCASKKLLLQKFNKRKTQLKIMNLVLRWLHNLTTYSTRISMKLTKIKKQRLYPRWLYMLNKVSNMNQLKLIIKKWKVRWTYKTKMRFKINKFSIPSKQLLKTISINSLDHNKFKRT